MFPWNTSSETCEMYVLSHMYEYTPCTWTPSCEIGIHISQYIKIGLLNALPEKNIYKKKLDPKFLT